jgi:prepilin-type N-terminal cleavage/methylation domain-containing protein
MEKRNIDNLRKAFSMVELIFVIVVLGIVSTYYSDIITQVYKSYILQKATHNANVKTTLAADQIANRLRYAIPGTIYRRTQTTGGVSEMLDEPMTQPADSYVVLQWVAYDKDGFEAGKDTKVTSWSGFCDVDDSSATVIKTPGSDILFLDTIIKNLGSANGVTDGYIYFPRDYTPYKIVNSTSDSFTLAGTGSKRIVEHYKFAWTSYALVVEGSDLYLYYNFPAVPKVDIPSNAQKALLLKNIATFKFRGDGQTIRFKICKAENIGEDFNVTSCKEKAVF